MLTSYRTGMRLIVSLAFALVAVTTAQAARYVGAWDPLYGASIVGQPTGNLAWRGQTLFDVPAAPSCFTNGVSLVDCLPGASIVNAEVTFYDFIGNQDLARIVWPTGTLAAVSIFAILDDGVKPVQFETAAFPFLLPQPIGDFSNDAPYGNFLSFAFALDFAIAYLEGPFSGPLLRWSETNCEVCLSGVNGFEQNPAILVVTPVPEPAGLALMATALLAAGVVSRRKMPGSSRRGGG